MMRNLEEAVTKLESVLDQFPNHLFEMTWDIAVLSSFMRPRNNEKIMAILEFGNSKGLWYSLNPQDKRWEECKDLVRFQKLVTENANRKALAQERQRKERRISTQTLSSRPEVSFTYLYTWMG